MLCVNGDGERFRPRRVWWDLADIDNNLEPFVNHVWEKPAPFPTLLDPTFATRERYDLSTFGTLILIDPDGHLVEGDETTLAEKLKEH